MSNPFHDPGFVSHSYCLMFDPLVIWVMIASNSLIAAAYFAIPVLIVRLVGRKMHMLLHSFTIAFAVFIFSCGTGHVMDVVVLYYPAYWLQNLVNSITAITSVYTAAMLARYSPSIKRLLDDPESLEGLKDLQGQLSKLLRTMQDKNVPK